MEVVKVEKSNGIATISVGPALKPVISTQVLMQLDVCFSELKEDPETRVIIIMGEGRNFGFGADTGELAKASSADEGMEIARRGHRVFSMIEFFPKPVIAAVRGRAWGGSFELALACHFRIALTKSEFSLPEINLGIIPGFGGTQRLAKLIGKSAALEWILTGKKVSAEDAPSGLVNMTVASKKEFMDNCTAFAERISENGEAVAMAIQAVQKGSDKCIDEGQEIEARLFGRLVTTKSAKQKLDSVSKG